MARRTVSGNTRRIPKGKPKVSFTNKHVRMLNANFEEFYKRLQVLGGFNGAMAMNLGKWVNEKDHRGLFSALMARKARMTVMFTIARNGNHKQAASVNWSVNTSSPYNIWKHEHYGNINPWYMEGNVLNNIVTRKGAKGWDIGIDRRKRIPRMQFGERRSTSPWRKGTGNPIKIERYASYIEYGTHHTSGVARPLFGPSFLKTVQEDFPKLAKIVQRSLQRSTNILRPEDESRTTYTGGSEGSVNMGKGMDEGMFGSARAEEAQIISALGGDVSKKEISDFGGREHQGRNNELLRADELEYEKFLGGELDIAQGDGMSAEESLEWMKKMGF